MNKFLIFVLIIAVLHSCQTESEMTKSPIKLEYPNTQKDSSIVDNYGGTLIKDEYRWLEVDTSQEVKEWVGKQNDVTFDYLENIPYRESIKERYEELFDYVKVSSPFKVGEYYFFNKNEGLQNQSVIYYQKGLDGTPEVFLDPNAMSDDGTVSINLIGFSQDNKYVTYSSQEGGSDWQQLHVIEIATKKRLSDELKWVKFSGANWYKDGFFYSRYPAPNDGLELSAKNEYHAVYYHKLGDDQSKDVRIFGNEENPLIYHFTGITESKDFLILYASTGTDGFETYYKDLKNDGPITKLTSGFKNKSSVVDNVGNHLLVMTDIDAPKYRLVDVDLDNPDQSDWKDVIPETEHLLQSVSTGANKLWANYLQDVTTRIYRYDTDGNNKMEIKLPGLGSAGGFGGKKDDDHFFYSFSSFTIPNTIYKYDVDTDVSEPFFKADLKFNPDDFVEKQVFYTSKDGTKVPMFIVHKKGLELDGNNPTYLYAYGGFNVNLTPSFSTSRIILLENGGVFAMPNLRGGGEYGEEWHKAGMLHNKQNVFDDFIAAAEYLIDEKYTSSEKLAISGGSNGGLLVGAVMTQRPELYAATFPAVGVMDMLRYHKFTVGWGWVPEYGSSEDPEHFENLLSYSPLHNLKEGVEYPATMITTADHDDRVVPAHSFKFGAKLQEVHKGDNPVLLRIAVDAGHGAGKPTSKIIEEQADKWSFFFYNTNSPVKYIQG
jgi:prolyl oligopeptidase